MLPIAAMMRRKRSSFTDSCWVCDFQLAIAEDNVPSTGEPDPYMHVFLDAGNGNVLAFFELPTQKPMGRDANTPAWVQHIALRVGSFDELMASKKHLESLGIDVLGPTHHGIFKSIYFFDPNGHRLELAADIGTPDQMAQLHSTLPMTCLMNGPEPSRLRAMPPGCTRKLPRKAE